MAEAGLEEYDPIGFERIALPGALTVPGQARMMLVQAEGANVRWRDDGTPPTAAIGMLLQDGETISYTADLESFRAVVVAGVASLNVSYYR